jgi:putative ABC transport system permease protein
MSTGDMSTGGAGTEGMGDADTRAGRPAAPGQPRGHRNWRPPRGITVWLALLTLLVVFAATAGVRETLATRTQALRQTIAATPLLSSTIQVASSWQSVVSALPSQQQGNLSEDTATEIGTELRRDLSQGVVRLAPAAADWVALTSRLNMLSSAPPGVHGATTEVEVAYRQPLRQHVRLLSGAFPAAPVAKSGATQLDGGGGFYPVIQVLVTQQTAARFGLKAGSLMRTAGPDLVQTGQPSTVTFQVSGIVAAQDPNSAFWSSDPAAVSPSLQYPRIGPPYWVGGVLAMPGASEAVQADFGAAGINVQWMLPLALNQLTGGQAEPLKDALSGLSSQELALSGDLGSVSTVLAASTGLVTELAPFIAAAQSADVLLWLLYASLTVAALVVLLLTARMVVVRRSAELMLIRARGASLRRLSGIVAGDAALLCVPALAAGVALGVAAVPSAGGLQPDGASVAWWLPVAAVLAVVVAGPALLAAGQNRLRSAARDRAARDRRASGRRSRARARPVLEVFLILAAAGGIFIFRQQGLQPGSGVNLYTSAAPVLVAVPAVIIVFRLYPLVLRWLLRAAARTAAAPAFLGLARAARSTLTPALPAFALVLALTVAAFAGMVREAVTNGQVAASWSTLGADATITPSPTAPDFTIPAAAASAIARVSGVSHAARVYQANWFTAGGIQVTGVAVDPADYAALVASTEGYPALPAGLLATAAAGAAQPVLASPSAAAALGRGTVALSTTGQISPLKVQVAGTLASTPAVPKTPAVTNTPTLAGSAAFIVLPLAALRSSATPAAPVLANDILLTGSGIDHGQLTALVSKDLPGGAVTFRSDVLAGLSGAPLQHGAMTVITLSIVVAAALGLAVMLLELALGAAERDATLARLATMGLGPGQRIRVVALELLPAVIAAALAAWACALVLPPVVRPVIDLSVFTGSNAAVPLVPDVAAVALPLAGLVVLAALALGIEIWAARRRGVASSLRVGE